MMNAKPHRSLRTLRVRADENEISIFPSHFGKENAITESSATASSNPTSSVAQQRNRSATALSTLSTNVSAVNLVVKRNAFGDVTNTVSANRRAKDDSSILKSSSGLATLVEKQETRNQGSKSGPSAAASGYRGTNAADKASGPALTQSTNPVSKRVTHDASAPDTTTAITKTTQSKPPIPHKSAARQSTVYRDVKDTVDGAYDKTRQQVEERSRGQADAVRSASTNHNTDAGNNASKVDAFAKSNLEANAFTAVTTVPQQLHGLTANHTRKSELKDVSIDDISNIEIKSTSPTGSESPGTSVADFVDHIDVDDRSEAGDYDDDEVVAGVGHHSCCVDAVQNIDAAAAPTPADVSMKSPGESTSCDVAAPARADATATAATIISEPDMCSDEDEDNYQDDERMGTTQQLRGQETTTMVLFPEVTQRSKKEIANAKQIVETTRTPEIDDECWDVTMVTEYGDDIFDYMREVEVKLLPNPHYMDNQTEIQWSMRSVLMDWIVQVHLRFNLIPETLFLTVNYIDRFLSSKVVSLGKLQLVGATAIFIAAKYEEVTCPSLAEIIYMVDNTYTAEEILKAERFMLAMLQFELGWPGPMSFLRRISKADEYDYDTRTLAKYLLEVTIMDERFVGAPASFLAAGAHCLARLMLKKGTWTPAHVYYSNYTYTQLHPVLLLLLDCVDQARTHHPSVQEKYSHSKYKRASTFVEKEMTNGFKIPDVAREEISTTSSIKDLIWGKQWTDATSNGLVTAK